MVMQSVHGACSAPAFDRHASSLSLLTILLPHLNLDAWRRATAFLR